MSAGVESESVESAYTSDSIVFDGFRDDRGNWDSPPGTQKLTPLKSTQMQRSLLASAAIFLGALLLRGSFSDPAQAQEKLGEKEAVEIATEAYIYGYSLITTEVTRVQMTNVPKVEGFRGPMNQFINVKKYPPADYRGVSAPNADTLYSFAWLDLTVSLRNNPKFNDDGSLTLYFQNESPGKDNEANWLPAPKGDFIAMLRMYWPKASTPSILDGTWQPPAVKKVK